jgi:signal transduction histidine kinase
MFERARPPALPLKRARIEPEPQSSGGDVPVCRRLPARRVVRKRFRLWVAGRNAYPFLIPPVVMCVFAVLFVVGDVVEQKLIPAVSTSTALRHALLTLRAGLATGVASAVVFLIMHRQSRQLSETAARLTRLLESFRADPAETGQFENPHRLSCREVFDCDRTDCPVYNRQEDRCWQIKALGRSAWDQQNPERHLQQCQECPVYRWSCPDALTELGESMNNLMFLLEEDAKQLGRMRAQMVEKQKMVAIGQMAAGIAHEIGNPLSSISSIVQMQKRSGTSPKTAEQLDLIETHIKRISGTVRQLVSLARPGPDQWELVDIEQILADVVRLISFERRSRKVEIDFKAPKRLPRTYGLRGQLQQVFINLALNALDAMPNGGKLAICAESDRRDIFVSMEDTGCGIAAELSRRVFEPFFTTKQPGQGTGLGLSVSYSIVQKHGGTIDFRSVVNQGTVVAVQLPILDHAPEI